MLSKRLRPAAGHFYRLRVNPAMVPCLLEHSLARREEPAETERDANAGLGAAAILHSNAMRRSISPSVARSLRRS